MRIMGDDVDIEVCDVPQEQPFERTDDCFLIIDQYGEEHIICEDGGGWITRNAESLSPDGFLIWLTRAEPENSAASAPSP